MTHDGGVAVVEDGRLRFSVEMEKIGGNPRHAGIDSLDQVTRILRDEGIDPDAVDEYVVDGWDGAYESDVVVNGATIRVAGYADDDSGQRPFEPARDGTLRIGGRDRAFRSFPHLAGHVASAVATAPFPAGVPTLVLVWDGGSFPRLYALDDSSDGDRLRAHGPLFHVIGHAYAMSAHHFGPYRRAVQTETVDDLSVAGKLMAYVATGRRDDRVARLLGELVDEHFEGGSEAAVKYRASISGIGSHAEPSHRFHHAFFDDLAGRLAREPARPSDEDVLRTVHEYLGDLLAERLAERLQVLGTDRGWHLVFVGGCALNIKWNSRLRGLPGLAAVWVPPFPNDSGSAIGAAVLGAAGRPGPARIEWDVRAGPPLPREDVAAAARAAGWDARPCDLRGLAEHLHRGGRPVVFLDGRAELGPRALGGRSILAPAVEEGTKDLLNDVKRRERFRPVAPICLEEHAPELFDPGAPDPYMLYDHDVRAAWRDRIPAVVHLDGTARLQTLPPADRTRVRRLLEHYHDVSGLPVLCNTSANDLGSGFFPGAAPALAWAAGRGVDAVWADGTLATRGPAA